MDYSFLVDVNLPKYFRYKRPCRRTCKNKSLACRNYKVYGIIMKKADKTIISETYWYPLERIEIGDEWKR